MLQTSIDREAEFQYAYLGHARLALDSGLLESDRAAYATYQISETLRRVGREVDAPEWYIAALEHPDCPAGLLALAREREATAEQGPAIDAERLDALIVRRIKRLSEDLADAETAEDAAEELVSLPDPRVQRPLVAALAHESNAVRSDVARAMRYLPKLSDAALDALANVLIEDEGRAEQNAATTLRAYGSERSAEAFRVGIDSFQLRVAEICVDALGLVGTDSDVADLLEILEFRPSVKREVLRSLCRISNREFPDLDAFRAWWEKHNDEPHGTWVRTGYAEQGLDFSDLEGDALIQALIDALEHEKHFVRVNVLRDLRPLTGQRFGAKDLAWHGDSPRTKQARRMALIEWRRWFESR